MNCILQGKLNIARRDHPRERLTASSRVYGDLKQHILSLELPPGTPLFRAELAARYEVSQTPIRDAMQRLEQDGLVRIYPQSRTLVTRIEISQVYEAHFLRTALEIDVVRRLALNPVEETLARAHAFVAMQKEVLQDHSPIPAFQELDECFHRVLFEGLGLDGLYRLVLSRSGHLDRVRRLQPPTHAELRHIIAGHEAILDGVATGNEAAAVAAMRNHLSKIITRVEEIRLRYAEMFSSASA